MDPSREKLLQLIDQYRYSRLSHSPDDEFVRELVDVAGMIEDLETTLKQEIQDCEYVDLENGRLRSRLDDIAEAKNEDEIHECIAEWVKERGY